VGRNSELIRQWTILQQLAARRPSNTIPVLSAELKVSTRTIRRDLEALQAAGFPIYDEVVNGTKFWRLDAKTLVGALARNALTLPELNALYYSRALLKGLAGTALLNDLQGALDKLGAAFPAGMKKFLDRLPEVITAKPSIGRPRGTQAPEVTTRLFEAATAQRVISMRYDSKASRQEKEYIVHPYRLVHAQQSLYLQAFVPAYGELRIFLVDRIRRLSVQEETFERVAELGSDPFSKSMGANSGPTCTVRLRFDRQIASIIKDRTWHKSQQLKDRPDGSVGMTLEVCDDFALRQWILGFGRSIRVLAPTSLVEWMLEELAAAREQYEPGRSPSVADGDVQAALPFLFSRLASA
jgi:predicted DNA-binding transcriptional regulator YafY